MNGDSTENREDIYICPCCGKTYIGSAKCPTCDEDLEEADFCEICGEPIFEEDEGVCETCIKDHTTVRDMMAFNEWGNYGDEVVINDCWKCIFSKNEINDILEETFRSLPMEKQEELMAIYIKANIGYFKEYLISIEE